MGDATVGDKIGGEAKCGATRCANVEIDARHSGAENRVNDRIGDRQLRSSLRRRRQRRRRRRGRV